MTRLLLGLLLVSATCVGCGTTREREATEQLVLSNAVDRSISSIDFRPLTGRKVYLDTSYLRQVKTLGFVNSEYVTSALRQQIAGAGCLLQDTSQDADIIIEARCGTLGSDDHRVTFGIPENNSLSSAASLIPNSPSLPSIPEIAVARRDAREAAAKIAAFAYDRETRKAVWQSGVRQSTATARDTYVLGVGPFQAGSIREGTKLAGSRFVRFGDKTANHSPSESFERPPVDYTAEIRFQDGWPIYDKQSVAAHFVEDTGGGSNDAPTVEPEEPVDGATSIATSPTSEEDDHPIR
ncbi:DUF6655 family protein [Novipirellula artificiosorum]|nr:DUF6655 family protein [Novipirellula artificiosorum]